MHSYGDKDFTDEMFNQVDDAAWFIGEGISKWGRIGVRQTKEKFGTCRVYCSFYWYSFHSIIFPCHLWIHKWWPHRVDAVISRFLMPLLNRIAFPIKKSVYRYFYQKAVDKWPHLAEEIVCSADWDEYLNGIALKRYQHSNYWREMK